MAVRSKPDEDQKMAVKMLTMSQEQKREAQRKLLMERGLKQRKEAIKREKYYGGK